MDVYENPFKKRSISWALMEEDFSDLTLEEIAEIFGTNHYSIAETIRHIYRKTGYKVPYVNTRNGAGACGRMRARG